MQLLTRWRHRHVTMPLQGRAAPRCPLVFAANRTAVGAGAEHCVKVVPTSIHKVLECRTVHPWVAERSHLPGHADCNAQGATHSVCGCSVAYRDPTVRWVLEAAQLSLVMQVHPWQLTHRGMSEEHLRIACSWPGEAIVAEVRQKAIDGTWLCDDPRD